MVVVYGVNGNNVYLSHEHYSVIHFVETHQCISLMDTRAYKFKHDGLKRRRMFKSFSKLLDLTNNLLPSA